MAFRGPMNIYNIAVYQPTSTNSSSGSWKRVSSWAAGEQPENVVFMNNMGGSKSGEWSSTSCALSAVFRVVLTWMSVVCAGSSQSYANGDWTDAASKPNADIAKGYLDQDHEIVRHPRSRHVLRQN